MTEAEARSLVARLAAGFPRERLDSANVLLYTERLARLAEFELAYLAVDRLLDTEERLPTIATIRACYESEVRRRNLDRVALPQMANELTEEQRAANLHQAAVLLATVWPEKE